MKSFLSTLIICLVAMTATVAQTSLADFEAENDGWMVILEDAYTESQKTGKPIMANFTGSDWCGVCKRLTASVFIKDDFKSWADNNVILLELDFPRRKTVPSEIKAQNASMQRAFGVRGFPTIWLFDLEKDEKGQFNIIAHGKTGYSKTVQEFTDALDQMIVHRSKS